MCIYMYELIVHIIGLVGLIMEESYTAHTCEDVNIMYTQYAIEVRKCSYFHYGS